MAHGRARSWLAALAALLVAAPMAHAEATTWFVASGGSDGADCATAATACATVSGAIAKAADGDTIAIGAGTFTAPVDTARQLTLAGAGEDATALDGGGAAFCVRLPSGGSLRDLKVLGDGDVNGAAVLVAASAATAVTHVS